MKQKFLGLLFFALIFSINDIHAEPPGCFEFFKNLFKILTSQKQDIASCGFELNPEIESYLWKRIQQPGHIKTSLHVDGFDVAQLTSEEMFAEYLYRSWSLTLGERELLLWILYQIKPYPAEKYPLIFLLNILVAVAKNKECEDSPKFDPFLRIFDSERKKINAFLNEQ
ncbi:MAG: hypothetical protein LBE99_01950 [Puniceicoccales bacterium]|jgi:hypothetical protein|nr:hypothetical protein [Puniceicoccales bacterium]